MKPGKISKGDIVVVPFPFSDLTGNKRRPAFVAADLVGDDIILCQVTSQTNRDQYSVLIESKDFISGGLPQSSNIRPNKLFTADRNIVLYVVGQVNQSKIDEVVQKIAEILKK